MHELYEEEPLPTLRPPRWANGYISGPRRGKDMEQGSPFEQYLLWLRGGAELAQQVADAWNAVVKRGKTDAIHCHCHTCFAVTLPNDRPW